MKKQYKKIIALLLVLIAGMLMIFVGNILYNNETCNNIRIGISNHKFKLITPQEVREYMLDKYDNKIIGQRFKRINTLKLMQILLSNPYISDAQVSHKYGGTLNVQVTQAIPIVKIITDRGEIFIDSKGNLMSARPGRSFYVIVANGKINTNIKLPISQKININSLNKAKNSSIFSIFAIAKYLDKNKFWLRYITQIYIKGQDNIVLSPRFGDFIIALGDTTELNSKFERLHIFLDNIGKIGWNKYSAINLKYKNQIVCTKK